MTLTRVQTIEGTSAPGQLITCIARLVHVPDGIYPDETAFASGTYTITDISTYPVTTVVQTTNLTPISSYIFSFPQNSNNWAQDLIGCNFVLTIPANVMVTSNHVYLIECALETVDGSSVSIVFRNITSNVPFGYVSGGLVVLAGVGSTGISSVVFDGITAEWAVYDPINRIIRAKYYPTSSVGNIDIVVTFADNSTSTYPFKLIQSEFSSIPPQTNLATATWMPQALNARQGWDGNIWWTSNAIPQDGADPKIGDLWNSTPTGTVTQLLLPGSIDGQYAVNQLDCCAGPDGAMFSLSGKTSTILYRIAPPFIPGEEITSVSLASFTTTTTLPNSISVGLDGNLWITFGGTIGGSVLVRVSPDLQTVNSFPISGYVISGAQPNKNGNLYATASPLPADGAHLTHLLEISTNGIVLSDTLLPNAVALGAATLAAITWVYGCDGFLYFKNDEGVLKADPANLSGATQIPVICQVGVGQVTPGTDGNLWCTAGNQVVGSSPAVDSGFAIITPSGTVNVIIVPGSSESENGSTFGVVAGLNGNMYLPIYTNRQAGSVGYLVKVIP